MSARRASTDGPVVRTEALASGGLAGTVAGGTAPAAWYAPRPSDAAAWRARLDEVRTGGGDWHETLAPAFGASGAAAARLARSAGGAGAVVTTGQQPGLFGGPVYTWSKALSALALADALEQATGLPVAPVFWAATDDADFAEASYTYVGLPGGAERLAMPAPALDGAPMADVPLGDVTAFLEVLERGAGSVTYPEALDAARRAYASGETVGSAYVRLLREMLEPLGIAVLDASHAAVRDAARPTLVAALERAADVERALEARTAELRAAGHEPQVAQVPGLSLVFGRAGAQKQRLTTAAAADASRDASAVLSPNVLLRPVIERAILPTAAYVAGPGEIAYFAQVSAVADALGAACPLVVPRWSGTIVEPHVSRIMHRLGVDVDALRDPHAVASRVARGLVPADVRGGIEQVRAAIARLDGGTLVPAAVTDGARAQLDHRLARFERRLAAAVKRRDDAALRDVATARGSLFPGDVRQERALNLIPLLARYGPALLRQMRERAAEHAAALVGAAAREAAAR